MKLIVGLGNPGKRYVNNRHNVGFHCIDCFAQKQGISLNQRKAQSLLGAGDIEGTKVVLVKPRTFMNLSGEAVAALMHHYRLPAQDLLVIYDDLDLPLGKIRLRERGGSGGHNGVKSIIAHLNSQDFPRFRVGIGPREDEETTISKRMNTVGYVLGDFDAVDRAIIQDVYPEVADAIHCLITDGITAAMNKYN